MHYNSQTSTLNLNIFMEGMLPDSVLGTTDPTYIPPLLTAWLNPFSLTLFLTVTK